jgi:hypothetical protein
MVKLRCLDDSGNDENPQTIVSSQLTYALLSIMLTHFPFWLLGHVRYLYG